MKEQWTLVSRIFFGDSWESQNIKIHGTDGYNLFQVRERDRTNNQQELRMSQK